MKKLFTTALLFCLCNFLMAQEVLNIEGTITYPDGNPAVGIFVGLEIADVDIQVFEQTDENGNYQIETELDEDNTQGCFLLFIVDCTAEIEFFEECYNPGNYDFTFDYDYCANGSDICEAFINVIPTDSIILLEAIAFGEGPFTYQWDNGSTSFSTTVPAGTEGVICVLVTSSNGCEVSTCIDLTPPDPCFVQIYEEHLFGSAVLYAEGYGQTEELEYIWSTGETGEVIDIAVSGEYCVTLVDGEGCESFDCRFVEIDTSGFEDCFSFIHQTFDDSDSVVILSVETFGTAPYTYLWSFNDVVISTEDNIIPEESGVYCVEVTDAEGCFSVSCYDYFIWEECGVWIGCDPIEEGVQLWAFGYGAEPLTYEWNTGDTEQELIVTVTEEYCVTVTDATGCTSTTCMLVNVEEVNECFGPIEIELFEESAVLTVNPIVEGDFLFIWSTGDSTQSITVTESGFYCVEAVELNTGCSFSTCEVINIGQSQFCDGYIETTSISDSIATLTVFAFNGVNDTTQFQYAWSTGETTQTITVSEEGEYCVTATSEDGCSFVLCTNVVLWGFPEGNTILGVVYDEVTGSTVASSVDLYTINDDGTLELYSASNEVLTDGVFLISQVEAGTYLALATAEADNYAPTYAFNTTSWEEADLIQVDGNSVIIPVEISMVTINGLDGNGTIEGSVSTDGLKANGEMGESRSSGPLAEANVMLMHSDIHVGQTFTQEDGSFRFTNLPYGTFEVVLEIPGQEQKIIEVTLSEDNPNVTDIDLDAESGTVSTNDLTTMSSLTLSPNPTSNILVVESRFTEAQKLMYSIVDMQGRVVVSEPYNVTLGDNKLEVDVTLFENGVYNLVLQTQDEVLVKRFIKI